MARRYSFIITALKILDMGVLVGIYLLAAYPMAHGSQGIGLSDFFAMRIKVGNFFLFLIIVAAWHIVFLSSGVYESQRLSSLKSELLHIFRATTACSAFTGVFAFVTSIRM